MDEQNNIEELKERLNKLESELSLQSIRLSALENKPEEYSVPPQIISQPEHVDQAVPFLPKEETVFATSYASAPDSPPAQTVTPDSNFGNLESAIGGTWFNRIGIVAIILGIGYFLREAARRGWITPIGRVAIGTSVGITLLVLGDRLRVHGYKLYSQSFTGGAIAVFYLVVYASYSRYQLIGHTTAFALMSVVTALSVYLSARYDAISMSVLAVIGGFLTPIILSTGRDNQVALFTYIALIDLGVLITAYFKRWCMLNFLVFAATILMFGSWMFEWYDDSKLTPTILFMTLFFLIFSTLAIFHNIAYKKISDGFDLTLLTTNAFLYFGTAYSLLNTYYPKWMGLFAITVSIFYLALGYVTHKANSEDKFLVQCFISVGCIFLILAVPIQFDQHVTTIVWGLQGAALCWRAIKAKNERMLNISLMVFSVAFGHWIVFDLPEFAYKDNYPFTPIINNRGISAIFLICSLLYSYKLCSKHKEMRGSQHTVTFNSSIASIIALVWLTADLNSFFSERAFNTTGNDLKTIDDIRFITMTLLWSLFALAAMMMGVISKIKILRKAAIGLFIVTLIKVSFFNLIDLFTFDPARYFPILNRVTLDNGILICLLAYWIYIYSNTEFADKFETKFLPILMIITANCLALLAMTFEVIQIFESSQLVVSDDSSLTGLYFAQNLALSILWGLYGSGLLVWGLWRNNPVIRYMSFILLFITIFKVFVLDMSRLDTIYRVASFMVLGIILVAASYLYQRKFRQV